MSLSRTKKAAPCEFPFKLAGKNYRTGCAPVDGEKVCAVEVDAKRNASVIGKCEQYGVAFGRDSPKRSSPKRSSPKRSSPKRSSPKRSSPKKTIKRRLVLKSKAISRKRGSPKRSSPKRSSPKRGSPKRSSPKRSSPKPSSGKSASRKSIAISSRKGTQSPKSKSTRSRKSKTNSSGKRTTTRSVKSEKMPSKKLVIVPSLKKSPSPVKMEGEKTYNKEFVAVLSELGDIMMRQGEPFRARAYIQAAESIMTYPNPITNPDQLKGVKGIGSTILSKLHEYVQTGTLKALERERNNPITKLTTVYGVGPKKAKELVAAGITTVDQLKERPELLTGNMLLGLKYYDDIEERIPRAEIDEYKGVLTGVFNKVTPPGSTFEIVGSYRRGAAASGDIDIIITNDKNNKAAFNDFLDALVKDGIVIELLTRGKTKSLTIARLPGKKARRVDFLYADPNEYAFAILYFTGSKIFNTVQRQRALDLGMTLNEHGLHEMVQGKKGKKIEGQFPDEQSIFKFLGMKYKTPEERVDGRAVVLDTGNASPAPKQAAPKATEKKTTLKVRKPVKKDAVQAFLTEGVGFLKTQTEAELSKMIRQANDAYYCNQKPIMSDNEYDVLREFTLQRFPKNKAAAEGHTQCNLEVEKNKVKLPYEMWSMDKIKPDTDALARWVAKYKGPYVLSCKLDGVSGMYSTEGPTPKLYTRGNGTVGQDVSHLIPFLQLPVQSGVVIRGEFIIPKDRFAEKYAGKFANPRNFVAGVVNQKKVDAGKFRDIDFVAYEVIKPELKPSEQMRALEEMNVEVVRYAVENKVSNELLSELLVAWRDGYKYEIDGVICCDDKIHPRKTGNPEHAFAFKMVLGDQIAEAKVVDVLWAPSKDGYLKPRVQIEPVVLGGAKIEYATGFNAKFIEDNKIGVGAVIKLIRSGDVIPHILSVVVPASKPQMPTVPYEWNDTHVDIILSNKSADEVVREKNITGFFRELGVDGLSTGGIKKLIAAGYDSVPKILAMNEGDFLKIDGFQKKTAAKLYNGIKDKMKEASLSKVLKATNIFGRGFGTKAFDAILADYPDILVRDMSRQEMVAKVQKVHGMAKKSAERFADELPVFLKWAKEAKFEDRLVYQAPKVSEAVKAGPLYGKKFVFTGFRDKELAAKLEKMGMEQGSGVSVNTFVVIAKDPEDETGKVGQAKKLGVPIMTLEQFKGKYEP